jgi:hypothetical protein
MQWRFTPASVTIATVCFLLAIGALFFAPFDALTKMRRGSGDLVRGVAVLLGEDGARYFLALTFAAGGVFVLLERRREKPTEGRETNDA